MTIITSKVKSSLFDTSEHE